MTTFTFATSGVHTPVLLSAHAAYSASRSLVNAGVDQVVPFVVQRPDTPTQHDITALFPSYAAAEAFATALRSEGLCAVSIADALRTNLLLDPHLRNQGGYTPSNGAATVTIPTTLGPSGQGYMRVEWTEANTTSPQSFALSLSGTGGIPVTAGEALTLSTYIRGASHDAAETNRTAVGWYDEFGTGLSTTNGASYEIGSQWSRVHDTYTAPEGAAYARPIMVMSGIFEAGDLHDWGDVLFESAGELRPFFSGVYSPSAAFDGAWTGPAHASTSVLVPQGVQFDGISSSQVRVQNTPGIGATEVQFTLTEVPA